MKLFVARWPDGTAWLVAAPSMTHVAEILDEESNPGECEVVPFRGSFAVELRLKKDLVEGAVPAVEFAEAGATTHYEMVSEVVKRGYPTLAQLLERTMDQDMVPEAAWRKAFREERRRELRPSAKWADAVKEWWEAKSGQPADRSAVDRRLLGVSIPGEPKIESPAQERIFEEAARRKMERIGQVLFPEGLGADPPPVPPKTKQPKRGKRRPR